MFLKDFGSETNVNFTYLGNADFKWNYKMDEITRSVCDELLQNRMKGVILS